jgi:hypothetical protein
MKDMANLGVKLSDPWTRSNPLRTLLQPWPPTTSADLLEPILVRFLPRRHRSTVSEETSVVASLIEAGSGMGGAAIGAALGLIGGDAGLVSGAAAGFGIGVAIRQGAEEFRSRVLAPRESARVGTTLAYAVTAVGRRRAAGESLRDDGFFGPVSSPDDRTPAEEIVEGVLSSAQKDWEEKKLRLYGELLASIAYSPWVSRGNANYLLKLFEHLTYRQVCLLALLERFDEEQSVLGGNPHFDARIAELDELRQLHLVQANSYSLDLDDAAYSLVDLLKLRENIDDEEIKEAADVEVLDRRRSIAEIMGSHERLNRSDDAPLNQSTEGFP